MINITVDINNIPDSTKPTKEVFTAFRNHQTPHRFQTAEIQTHASTTSNKNKNHKSSHKNKNYRNHAKDKNQAPAVEAFSQSWKKLAQSFQSKVKGIVGEGRGVGEEVIGAKLVAPILVKLHQKPNKLVSFNHHLFTTTIITTHQGGRCCASGACRKVWTWAKILSPNIRYFAAILRFVAIYAFYKFFY